MVRYNTGHADRCIVGMGGSRVLCIVGSDTMPGRLLYGFLVRWRFVAGLGIGRGAHGYDVDRDGSSASWKKNVFVK